MSAVAFYEFFNLLNFDFALAETVVQMVLWTSSVVVKLNLALNKGCFFWYDLLAKTLCLHYNTGLDNLIVNYRVDFLQKYFLRINLSSYCENPCFLNFKQFFCKSIYFRAGINVEQYSGSHSLTIKKNVLFYAFCNEYECIIFSSYSPYFLNDLLRLF